MVEINVKRKLKNINVMKNELLGLIKKAMISKNTLELGVLRLIKTEFSEFENAKDAKELTKEVETNILNKMVKQRNDSIEKFTDAGRLDLVKQEQDEKEFILTFLPKQLTESEIVTIIVEKKFPSIGECMNHFKNNHNGLYNGKVLSQLYNENK